MNRSRPARAATLILLLAHTEEDRGASVEIRAPVLRGRPSFALCRREGWAVATKREVRVRRVYEEPEDDDGVRVLVDRIWPRGMTKAKAALDEWCKDVAPSTELRKWYSHDPAKFEEFANRYGVELEQADRSRALQHLRDLADDRRLTLLTGTKDPDISEAAVLAAILDP